MGSAIGWRCKSCGAEEEYMTGCGMASCDVPETHARIAEGAFGKIAKQLLSKDFPLDVYTVDECAIYRCPECGKLVEGASVRFRVSGDPFDMVLHVPPQKCPACDAEFSCTEERTPLSDGDIAAHIEGVVQSGCPECGSKSVEPSLMILWD